MNSLTFKVYGVQRPEKFPFGFLKLKLHEKYSLISHLLLMYTETNEFSMHNTNAVTFKNDVT